MNSAKPPIIELVIGVQFTTQHRVDAAKLVLFWTEWLRDRYPNPAEAAYLQDEFEKFGAEERIRRPTLALKWESLPRIRFQFINDTRDRMIQLQDSRLILNWVRRDSDYPRFSVLHEEFSQKFELWRKFLETNNVGEIAPNQWELTYVNRIPQGELWQTPGDWHRISSRLFVDGIDAFASLALDDRSFQWRLRMPNDTGRITLTAEQVFTEDQRIELQLVITARGPAADGEIHERLKAAHDHIIQLFFHLATDEAKVHWGVSRS